MTAHIFKGIRFAQVPQRFAAPVDVDEPGLDDPSTRDVGVYGPQCPQVSGMMEQMLGQGSLPFDEDCHFLNVFTPSLDRGAALPVLAWVHGGGFVNGTGSTPWYHGASLAERYGVVVVNLNYRLGAFGFSHLSDHGGEEFADAGNAGLLDQLSALRWVQRNIESFGGDPGNVTIFGESAGGASVVSLLAAPGGAGLFHKAIALSPSITQLRPRVRAHEATGALLAAAGTDARGLRSLTAEQLIDAQRKVLSDRDGAFTSFAPTPGEPAMPEVATVAAAKNPVPLVVGTTKDEMFLFHVADKRIQGMDDEGLLRYAAPHFGEAAPAAIAEYRAHRPDSTPGNIASAIATDETFRVPAVRLAEARAAAGHPTWMHWFTWETPAFGGILRSCHALDIPFVFHNLDRPGVPPFTGEGPEREGIADFFSSAVTSFAASGDPGWPQFDTTRRATMQIDMSSVVVDDPEPALRALWERRA